MLNWIKKKKAKRDATPIPPVIDVRKYSNLGILGTGFEDRSALGVSSVVACLDVLSSDAAKFQLYPYQSKLEGGRIELKDHYLNQLLRLRPNPTTSASVFWRSFFWNAALQFGLAQIIRRYDGQIVALWNIPASKVEDIIEDRVNGTRRFMVIQDNGAPKPLYENEVIYCPNICVGAGKPPKVLELASRQIAAALAALDFEQAYYLNGGVLGKEIEFPMGYDLTKAQQYMDGLPTGLDRAFSDLSKTDGIKSSEPKRYEQGISSDLEVSHRITAIEICQFFSVEPSRIGVQSGNRPGGNAEYLSLQHLQGPLKKFHDGTRQEIDWKFFSEAERKKGFHVDYDIMEHVGYFESTSRVLNSYIGTGVLDSNEVRTEWLGLNPRPEPPPQPKIGFKPEEPPQENDEPTEDQNEADE